MVNELIYTRAFGELRCGISVPLNGAYRSFGTLEVLNKGNKGRFSSEDVYWLSMISASLSNCISFFRMEEHLSVYKQLIDILVSLEAPSQSFDLGELCELVAKILTKDFTPYKVCIVRLADNKDDLEIKIRAKTHTSDISWEERKDGSIKSGSKIAGEAYLTKMPKYVEDINDSEVENFINKAWIRKNNLRSFACLPLSIKDECVGTISVYAQYSQKFYENHKSFLENISFLTTSIIARARNIQDLRRIRKERNIIREKLLNSSLLISYDNLSRANLHQYKNELINFGQILSKIAKSSHISSKTKDFIDEQQGWIHQRITDLGDEMASESEDPIPTDLNSAVEEVLESFSFEFSDIQIAVRKMFDDNIPVLDIDERKVKDIIFNLLTNAERSIQRAGRARGEIMIQTAIDRSQKIANVQFSVEDNGEGIKKEIREKIFDKGFTTGKDAGGTGVGLFIVQEILNSYGGKIKVESIFGKGAKFLVEIPLERYRLH
jgi:signal transduction histidine kinase